MPSLTRLNLERRRSGAEVRWVRCAQVMRPDLKPKSLVAAVGHVGLPHDVVGAPDVVAKVERHPLAHVRLAIHNWKGRGLSRAHKRCI